MKTKQVTEQDAASGPAQPPVVAVLTRKSGSAQKRLLILCIVGAAIIMAAIGGAVLSHYRHTSDIKTVYAAQQQTLQASLSLALSQSDFQTQIDATSQLISGKAAGNFTIDSKALAQYHMQRGVAYLDLKQYSNAVSDFQKARSADATLAQASLQGEVQARYDLGQRQQLIPLFQQLAMLSKGALDSRLGTPELYQHYIDAIQHNQEIQLQ